MDDRSFVVALMAAVPEAFTGPVDEALPYVALGDARCWLEDHALEISILPKRAKVRPEYADVFGRFWAFVELQAQAACADPNLKTLLQIECFEGVGWVEDVLDYVGPATRLLLVDAQEWLATYNGQVGRWFTPSRGSARRP